LPQRSQKRSLAPSADAAAQGWIIGSFQPCRRPPGRADSRRFDGIGECSARAPRCHQPVAPRTAVRYSIRSGPSRPRRDGSRRGRPPPSCHLGRQCGVRRGAGRGPAV